MTTLLTERLKLRPFRASDAPALAAAHMDAETMRYFGYGVAASEAEAMERAETRIADYGEHWAERGYGTWALEDRADASFVGRCGLRYIDELGETELLYLIVRPRWRQGLASEASARALAFGFETCGLDEIVALAMPENIGSRRVMEKAGMRYADELRLWDIDLVRYRLRRDEFR